MNLFYDQKGRLHDKIVSESKPYPCNNSFLYSGEAHVLGIDIDVAAVKACWSECQTTYGFDRNPDGDHIPASSHDEVCGMFMMWSEQEAKSWYKEYKDQYFQVCNLAGFKPTPLYKLNPIRVVMELRALNREVSPRKATPKYPYIMPVTFRHAPQHTYFYKRCAGLTPSPIHTLFFVLSSLHTVFRGSISSKVLLGFKLMKLGKLGLGLSERLVNLVYNRKVDLKYMVNEYFAHQGHPIRLKINGDT